MTTPTAGKTTDAAAELPELPFPATPIEEMLRVFVKAVRAHQLYLPNNPVYKAAIDSVRTAFAPIWERTDEFSLTFGETEVKWFGRPVLVEQSKSADSLAWTFYKDGVREVQFLKGFESEELVQLFGILQRVRKALPEEDDLLTMLWQADFAYLRYRYVDLGAEGVAPLSDGGEPSATPSAGDVAAAMRESPPESRPAVVNMKDFDATLYFLDEKELEYLRAEIDREYHGELRHTVAATLFDIFEAQAVPAIRDEVAEDIEHLMLSLLAAGELRTVAYILSETQVAVGRAANLAPAQRDRLGLLPERLSAPEPLGQLLQTLDESALLPPAEELDALFLQLRPTALETIFAWMPRVQNPQVRTLVEGAAERLAAGNTAELVRLIGSSNPTVAAEAIKRATGTKTAAAVAPLARVLADGDVGLRQMAVNALTAIGSPGALQALEKAIDDSDRDVRIGAVRTLTAKSYRGVFSRIDAAVKGKAIRGADLTERQAFFEAFGAMCGDGGIAWLDGILNGKGLFGKRDDPEMRACAALALGRIGSKKAQEALQRAASEKDVVVRNAVTRALRKA